MRLSEALEQSQTGALRRVASAHGLPHDDSITRDELIARLGERLADAAYLERQFEVLQEEERDVLSAARASDGELRGLLVDLEHPGAAAALAERGWLFRVFAAAGPLRGEVFVVPEEMLEALPRSGHVAVPGSEEPAAAERRASDPAFNVFALLSAVTRSGGRLEDEVREWSEEPGGWLWDARWKFLQHLTTACGLLVPRADGAAMAAPGLARLLDEPTRLSERLWRAYLRDRGWSELGFTGIEDGAELADTIALRRAAVDALEQLPEARWVTLDAFSEWLRHTRPSVVREQLSPRGVVRLQSSSWDELERPLLRAFVLGPLYWLGAVIAARDGQSIARRPRGRVASSEPCSWDDAGELLAPARAQLGALLQAERYLVLRERGRVSRYQLVQAHVAAALGLGGSFAECRQLLTRLTEAALPTGVDERLRLWEQRFGALVIRPTVVLEARSAAELDEVLVEERVRPFVRARLGPRLAEVPAADALELATALRHSGHLPRVDAALRLAAEPRHAYSGLVDEEVLEYLLVSLLAFQSVWPQRLAELEGSAALLERLQRQFPPERLAELRRTAERLAGGLASAPPPRRRGASAQRRRTPRGKL